MPAGTTDHPLEDHGGSYLVRGKERQPTPTISTKKIEKQPKIPDDVIARVVKAARSHFEELTRIRP